MQRKDLIYHYVEFYFQFRWKNVMYLTEKWKKIGKNNLAYPDQQ